MDGVEDEVATEDGNINNDECYPVKIISNKIKPNREKGSAETIIVKVKSPSKLKRKKEHHLEVVIGAEGEVVRDEICNIDDDKTISKKKIKPNEETNKGDAEISDEKVKSPPRKKRSELLQDNVQGVEQASTTPDGAKKGPSRSAIRKKAKRQWKRELAKIQKMEGFVLPPSESTRFLKDKEVLCEDIALAEAIEGENAGNLLDYAEVNKKEPVNNGILLVPKEELEDEPSLAEIVSKKRKASTKLRTPKSEHLQENVEGVEQACTAPDGAKKVPSRSARRQKAKKQWKREVAKISQKMEGFVLPPSESIRILKDEEVLCVKKEEVALAEAIEGADAGNLVDHEEVNRKEPVNNGMILLAIKEEKLEDEPSSITASKKRKASTKSRSSRSEYLQPNVEGVEQASTAPDGAKKGPSRSVRRKKAKRQWKRELAKISQKMEGFVLPPYELNRILKDMEVFWKGVALNEAIEGADAGNLVDYAELNRKESVKSEHLQENVEGVEQASTALDGAKKVPSRSARRKKAKKQRKRELAKISQKPEVCKAENKEANGHPKGLVIDFVDFDKLPLCTSPKEGDVIAYRLVELSSSWTPELSSYRVGKILHFDANNIILNPVPEYPIVFDKMDEDGPDNYSLYEEDGSLEIKFAGLVDVRSVEQSNDTDLIEIKIEREWN